MKLPNEIDEYLASRNFSENTRSNYHYDLVSLQAFFEDKSLTTENLELYKIQISNLSPAAQKEDFECKSIFAFPVSKTKS